MTEGNTMTTVLDRLTAWVEKQSSIGPAAFKQALAEIRRDVEREAKAHRDVKPLKTEVFSQQEEDAKLKEALGRLSEEAAAKLAEQMTPGEIIRAHELWKWLNKAAEPVAADLLVQELGTHLGEFARDELGASLADVDAAIAADKEQERVTKPKKRAAKPRKVKA